MKQKNRVPIRWYENISKVKNRFSRSLESAFLAKVLTYDKKKHIADIQPLANWIDGTKSAQYLDVPVAESCYRLDELLDKFKSDLKAVDSSPEVNSHFLEHYPKKKSMRVDAVVIAVTMDRDIDNWDGTGNTFTPNTGRMHDANDSIIVSVYKGDDDG